MTKEEAVATLDAALARVETLRSERLHSAAHAAFMQSTGLDLARIFGSQSVISINFGAIDYQTTGQYLANVHNFEAQLERRKREAYLRGLDIAEGILRSAREQLLSHGVDRILAASRIRSDGAKVFISHGTETPALARIERYVRALGLNPIIVGREPSEGMAVDDLVEKRMGEADCAIILATANEEVAGRKQPRPNVIHEIGLAQELLDNKVIYLKEIGCDFPSNVGPKVWENFTQQNLESAFEKIGKELRAFGLL